MTDNLNQNGSEIVKEDVIDTRPFTWWERLKYVFINPNKLFDNLREYPKVLFPILFVSVGLVILTLIRFDSYKEFLIRTTMEQLARQGIEAPNVEDIANIQVYISIISIGIVPILIWLVKSMFTNIFASLIGGDGSFKKAFSVISHAFIPVLLGEAIVAVISLIIGKFDVPIHFAVVLPETMKNGALYAVLSNINIFVIWYQILAIIGISQVYGITRKKSSFAVLLPWIAYLVLTGVLVFIANTAKIS